MTVVATGDHRESRPRAIRVWRTWRGERAGTRTEKGVHKNEFIRAVAKEAGLPQTTVSQVLSAAVRVVGRNLAEGGKVVWTGFGTFEVRRRSERQGINPQTRERIVIDATSTPGFTASSAFKERVLDGGK